jgi:glycosyltransferase involved in cell wall biosynthesis
MPDQTILYCTDTLAVGGAERQLIELITRLDRSRFAPNVICLHGQRMGYSLHFAGPLRDQQVPVDALDLKWNPFDLLRGVLYMTTAVWRVRPAVLHAVNHHSSHIARLSRLFLPRSVRLVVGIRTDYTPRQLLYERLEQWFCDVLVCNSPQMQHKLLTQSHLPARKVRYIPNGIDVARFEKKPDIDLRSGLALGAHRVLVMLARITQQKSPHLLAEAVGLLRKRGQWPDDALVFIVGERQDAAAQARLDHVIQQYDLAKVVHKLPETQRPELFYHAADVTVLASLWEGMPNSVLESLAARRPVIVSQAANAAGIIEMGVTGWIVPTGNVERLAETLHDVLGLSDEQLNAMRSACQQRAREYDMNQMVDSYQDLYERLQATPNP